MAFEMIFEKARWIAFFRTGNAGSGAWGGVKLISNLCVFWACSACCSQARHICFLWLFFALASSKGEIGIDHLFHLINVANGLGVRMRIINASCKRMRVSGVRRSADASQHLSSFIQLAHDTMTHGLKGTACQPHSRAPSSRQSCAGRPSPNCRAALSRCIGRIRVKIPEPDRTLKSNCQ